MTAGGDVHRVTIATPAAPPAILRALLAVVALPVVLWGALALRYAGPPSTATVAPIAWAVVACATLFVRPFGRRVIAFALAAAGLFAWWSTIRPSNDRRWQPDVARPPYAQLHGDELTIHNVRNFDYRSETDFDERWETRTYDLAKLDRLDFFMSYWGSPSIAHTIMSWAFTDGRHLAISIETRKELGETYSAVAGFFRQYELFYVVADERDVIRVRTNYRGEDVYLYPLRTPRERMRRALLQYVESMNRLSGTPEFYNAGTGNCTTTIRTNLEHMGIAMPFDWRFLVNGYLYELLYAKNVIDTSRPLDVVRASSLIDARAKAADHDPDFSARIRDGIVVPVRFDQPGAPAPPRASPGRLESNVQPKDATYRPRSRGSEQMRFSALAAVALGTGALRGPTGERRSARRPSAARYRPSAP